MNPRLLSALLAAACALAAALALGQAAPAARRPGVASGDGPSPVVYPTRRIPLRFDHSRHVREIGLGCVYCHTRAATSGRASDRLLPPPGRCDACHGTDHDDLGRVRAGAGGAERCSYCHEGHADGDGAAVRRVSLPPPNLKFGHARHRDLGIPCSRCHPGMESAPMGTRSPLPEEPVCTECHADSATGPLAASGECAVCHLARGGRLVTRFDTGTLLPPRWMRGADHGPDWIERHKLVAGADSTFCASCHAETECVECHDGRVRPRRIHPNDWISLHAVASRQDEASCGSCHRAQSFCLSCHARVGITESGPFARAPGSGRVHPPAAVWTGTPRTAQHHAVEAQRNATACASCHTERDCALCHATAGRGGRGGLSPHPPGFAASCGRAFAKNPRPCLFCHEPSEGRLRACR